MRATCILIIAITLATSLRAATPDTQGHFESIVAPIIEAHCIRCHNPGTRKGKLSLATRADWMTGGSEGPAITPGDAGNSLLIEMVTAHNGGRPEMPEEGDPLTDKQIQTLRRWVSDGADWPTGYVVEEKSKADKTWWSLRPLSDAAPPDTQGIPEAWSHNPIDRFVYAKLAEQNLQPNPPADRRTLIRRVTYDLTGLPPTPEEIDAFIHDKSPDAYDKLVDRLLASPRYGEQWGRHWLDVVRFGESNGFERNVIINTLWPFRDYIIRSFNDDKPFDRLVREHLAGDVIGGDDPDVLVGTAFLVCGPYDNVGNEDPVQKAQIRANTIDEMIRATSNAFLGLTAGCARCHNHKFDPILQADYYSLYATFAGVTHGERNVPIARQQQKPAGKRPPVNALHNVEKFEPVAARFVRFTIGKTNTFEPCLDELEVFEAGTSRNVALGATVTSSGDYTGNPKHQLAHINDGKYGNGRSWISNTTGAGWVQLAFAEPVNIDRVEWGRDREGVYDDRLAVVYRIEVATEPGKWREVASSADRATFGGSETTKWWVGNFRNAPGPFHVHIGGDPQRPGEAVAASSMSTLSEVTEAYELDANARESQRRLALAEWIVADDNPLTPRVLANRLWHWHFGTGIVSTPSDFGYMGGKPTHPRLLDYLARELHKHGWRIKPVHKLIVTSQTYRQASTFREGAAQVDGESRLLWRYPPRRLTGEQVRDAMLSIAGKLDTRGGGPGYRLYQYVQDNVATYIPLDEHGPETYRRAVYHHNARAQRVDLMTDFDCPDPAFAAPRRAETTTPLQALTLLNHDFTMDMAGYLAERLKREAGDDAAAQVTRAFALAYARQPSADELDAAQRVIEAHGLRAFCRALLNTNELLYVN